MCYQNAVAQKKFVRAHLQISIGALNIWDYLVPIGSKRTFFQNISFNFSCHIQ